MCHRPEQGIERELALGCAHGTGLPIDEPRAALVVEHRIDRAPESHSLSRLNLEKHLGGMEAIEGYAFEPLV